MNDEHDNAITDMEFLLKNSKPKTASEPSLRYFRDLLYTKDYTVVETSIPLTSPWRVVFQRAREAVTADGSPIKPDDDHTRKVYESNAFAQPDISKFIERLKVLPNKPKEVVRVTTTASASTTTPDNLHAYEVHNGVLHLEDGMYRRKSDGTIFKVYHTVHGANTQVAKRLKVTGDTASNNLTVKFVYEGRRPLSTLSPTERLTIAEAAEFGAVYGICCICSRTLTNELSIALGIGPVCGEREFGGDFEFMVERAKFGKVKPKDYIDAEVISVDEEDPNIDPVAEIARLKAYIASLDVKIVEAGGK